MTEGWSKKIYLQLSEPSEEDNASLQERVLQGLVQQGIEEKVQIDLPTLGRLGALCQASSWKITVLLGYDGTLWHLLDAESGDTSHAHYGLCVDLGSTTIIMELVDMNSGQVVGRESIFNPQIAFGEDILTRIFYTKDQRSRQKELQRITAGGFRRLMERLSLKTGIDVRTCASMTVAGNTTMTHFLLGLNAFGVFQSPYAVETLVPDPIRGSELGIPILGYVYCYPALANYLGGDILSGMIATGIADREEISVFLDVGTNGELIVGNRDFLVAGAGAAGPALEGGVVRTGMRAEEGAVDYVTTEKGRLKVHVIGEGEPRGICGSGIVDLLAEIFLNGWMDLRGKLLEEAPAVFRTRQGELAVEYAPGLYFLESDIEEFLKTKAAAMTMVEYMLDAIGLSMDGIGRFYVAGAFGTHINKESAVTIGFYPDIPREKIVSPGNTALEGARRMLLNRGNREKTQEILARMEYVQFGAVEDFLHRMSAAQAVPHTDIQKFPSVAKKLAERK